MKIVRAKKFFNFIIEDIEVPPISKDEALVKVNYCGVCGSDIHYASSYEEYVNLGHEVSGTVEKIGEDVSNVLPGDRVVIHSTIWCGKCENCGDGFPLLCANWGGGLTTACHGFSEYVSVQSRYLLKIDPISLLQASLIEPLDVALETVLTTDISFGQKVAILGPGPIGLMMIALCKRRGATEVILTGIEGDERRLQRGSELGADHIVFSDKQNLLESIKSMYPKGVDATIITASPRLIDQAIQITKYGGIITLLALGKRGEESVSVNVHELHVKKQQLRGSFPNPNGYFSVCKDLLRQGIVDEKKIITHIFNGAEEVEKAFRLVHEKGDGVIKAVVKM